MQRPALFGLPLLLHVLASSFTVSRATTELPPPGSEPPLEDPPASSPTPGGDECSSPQPFIDLVEGGYALPGDEQTLSGTWETGTNTNVKCKFYKAKENGGSVFSLFDENIGSLIANGDIVCTVPPSHMQGPADDSRVRVVAQHALR